MTKLNCIATCYMSSEVGSEQVQRYEDENGKEDIYEVPEGRVDEFLATGNFEAVPEPEA